MLGQAGLGWNWALRIQNCAYQCHNIIHHDDSVNHPLAADLSSRQPEIISNGCPRSDLVFKGLPERSQTFLVTGEAGAASSFSNTRGTSAHVPLYVPRDYRKLPVVTPFLAPLKLLEWVDSIRFAGFPCTTRHKKKVRPF